MDFFLSKFINRSSPSNGTELTNEESYCNQIEDETIKNSNNHSSEGRDQGLQVNQNLPDINFITNNASTCEEQINYNSNGSKIVLDESSKLNLNGINAEHKAMEILLSGSPKEESGVYPLSAASLFSEEIIPSTSNDSQQPASVAATASDTVNVKPVENSAIANKQTQFQSNKNISKVKESEENIDPIETRRFGDVSSLFSTPDSVSPNGTFSEATLPDIINTLPTITIDTQGNDILNISSLTSHLDALHVHNSEKSPNTLNATITKSNVSPSNISSDDELFAECESFPASANNSTTDFNATNKIETEQPINLDTNLKLNMQFVENCKSDSSTFSEVNIVQNVSQNDIEIDLNQNLKEEPNCSITSKAQDAISQRPEIDTINNNQDLNAKNLNKGSEVKTDYDAEKGSVFEILDEKTPEDSLEYIPTEQNIKQKQSSNSSIDIDSMSDSLNDTNRKTSESANFNHQLNISAQWSDIVSSINSIEQENLENSQLDLLNTTPQVIVQAASTAPIVDKKSSKYNTPNLVEEETLLYKKQDKICIFEHTNENIEKQTNAQNEQFKLNVIEVPLSKDDTSEKETTMNITSEIKSAFQSLNIAGQENNLSNSLDCRNCLNDVENLNIIQSVSESVQPSYSNDATIAVCSEKTDKTHDIVIENDSKLSPDRSFSSNSRDSLNDIEIMNITQNVSANIQPSYSNDVTIEVCDEAMNKTHNVAIKNNSQLLLDRTQESPKLTNITKERALNEMRNEPDINKEIVKKLDNASPSALENNFNNYFCKVQDEKFDCVTSTLNLGKANNDLKFNSVQVSNLNLPDGCNLTDKNDNSEHIVNAKRNLSNIPNCNNDFEYMDVDISFENENQEIFTKINDNIEKTETAPFSILPQNFEICKNMDEFKSIGNDNNVDLIFQSCDFEYLSKRGSNTVRDTRKDSILLKFDPLLGKPVPAPTNLFNRSTIHEEEDTISPETSIGNRIRNREKEFQIESNNILINVPTTNVESQSKKQKSPIKLSINKKDITRSSNTFDSPLLEEFENLERRLELEEREAVVNKMSVDVISNNLKIENDVQPNENINSEINSIEKQDLKMEDLEKKIKNEVLKTEDVEKKLKDAEQREEALLKRITDKDKTIAKMGGVIEAYEKAIAELIAEKEQITQNYEKQMEEIKAERDLNKQHLESLESTFTDLHVKYERSKQLLAKLKASEEELQAEKKRNLENLGLQEQRYEKMKNHAMQQLEIANNKLEHLTKNHQLEITKLKALLKKEEIAKSSVNEQLIQKSKENEELVKICEELINGGSAS
ncbi:uncharacterized protein LOC129609861 isoform X3 [Condylostylus longicornis]|uniref:uncharacterized protein LOC129609861 isoform X3 n=1 Tax=Condylostylus longicornis TaxID=2530218 RepID=UPI00244E0879|nr:uncharacterized protein LOC129609861 isoform X3 [Condylostylus longicornis]